MRDYIDAADIPLKESVEAVTDVIARTVARIVIGELKSRNDEALSDFMIIIASQALETREYEAIFTAVIETAAQLIYRRIGSSSFQTMH